MYVYTYHVLLTSKAHIYHSPTPPLSPSFPFQLFPCLSLPSPGLPSLPRLPVSCSSSLPGGPATVGRENG